MPLAAGLISFGVVAGDVCLALAMWGGLAVAALAVCELAPVAGGLVTTRCGRRDDALAVGAVVAAAVVLLAISLPFVGRAL